MELATERRDPKTARVPLDDVLIDLSPEGYDEFFAADGVNVGIGGLSMRAAVLPDVGSRLSCRFQSPHDGKDVSAECEVVWAQDHGANVGEFGLRFIDINQRDQHSIEQLVDAWNAELLAGLEDAENFREEAQVHPARSVRIELDGVAQALEGEVQHRASDALVIEQPLPFLRVGTGVSEGERRGTLQAVDLRVDDDVPRLVLTVCYDDESLDASFDDDSIEDEAGATMAEEEAPRPVAKVKAKAVEVAPKKVVRRETAELVRYDVADEPEPELEEAQADAVEAPSEAEGLTDHSAESSVDSIAAELKPDWRRSARKLAEKVQPLWARVRAFAAAAWVAMGPRARQFGGRIASFSKLLFGKARAQVVALYGRARKRSTTQVPARVQGGPRSKRAQGQKAAASPAPRRGIGRWVLLAVVVVSVAAFFATRGDASSTASAPKDEPSTALMEPELGDDTSYEEADDAALTQEDAPSAEPGEVPSSSPYAMESEGAESEPASESFQGGSLENTRSYSLRMSLPPSGVRGQDTEDGIRVVVLGSNAIDGARRIASADERVQSASILNHGEEAELRLRFTDGERPAYRVSSRGSSLVVEIGD